MKFIDKFYSEDKFRLNPCGKWCPYQLGYEEAPKEKDRCPKAVRDYSCHACWNREMPEPKSEPANANDFPGFEINDVVQLRDGNLYIVLPNSRSKDNKSLFYIYKATKGLICLSHCHEYVGNSCKTKKLYDVVKLWRSTPEDALVVVGDFFNQGKISKSVKPFWVEPPVKKMTLKEIEKELGYSIEIISEAEKGR